MNHSAQQDSYISNQQTTPSLMDSYESSENALMDSFKAAALKVTTLYKDSLVQNRKAYASGYQQALQDLYEFISSHPSTTISKKDSFITTPTEHGLLPVQDLLSYARERNDQLTSDMGLSTTTSERTQINNYNNININNNNQPQTAKGVIGAAVKNAFHPFQIDPNTQFTFLPPSPTQTGMMESMDHDLADGLKRRISPNDLSFMGRSLNSMNIDHPWNEPAFKRRHKRDS